MKINRDDGFANHRNNTQITSPNRSSSTGNLVSLDCSMRHWWVNQNQTYRHEIKADIIVPQPTTRATEQPVANFAAAILVS
jgi:hypothetical protein